MSRRASAFKLTRPTSAVKPTKLALSPFDDTHYNLEDGISTRAYVLERTEGGRQSRWSLRDDVIEERANWFDDKVERSGDEQRAMAHCPVGAHPADRCGKRLVEQVVGQKLL